MTSSNSVATRDSWSKLHSPLAAPSLPPIWGGLNRRLQKPPIFCAFWYRGTRDDIFNAHFFSKRNEPKKILLSPNPFLHIKGLNWKSQKPPIFRFFSGRIDRQRSILAFLMKIDILTIFKISMIGSTIVGLAWYDIKKSRIYLWWLILDLIILSRARLRI